MSLSKLIQLSILLSGLALFNTVWANTALAAKWQLNAEHSTISFVSVKKEKVGETHVFTDFSGSISQQQANIIIKPDSVDSKVPIRNERMREFLFETGTYPTIAVSSAIGDVIAGLKKGQPSHVQLPATLTLHGVEKAITLDVYVSKNGKNTLSVVSAQPVIIKAATFNLVEGINKLSELVGGLPIVTAVPVNFVLTFSKVEKS